MTKSVFLGVAASAKTVAYYQQKGRALARRWCGADGVDRVADVVLAFDTRARAGHYAGATLRLYREMILAHIRTLNAEPGMVAFMLNFDCGLHAVEGQRTSALKLKKVSQEDAHALLSHIRRDEGQAYSVMAGAAADVFEAILLVGLRPVEWTSARMRPVIGDDLPDMVADNEPTHRLVVRNAKHNVVRANGEERVIYVRLSFAEAQLLERVIAIGARERDAWPEFYKRLASALSYAGHSLWPRRKAVPSFYTARHQCMANAKVSVSPIEVAAIFGHASDMTARKHYSHSRNGDKKMHILAASRLSLNAVRNQSHTNSAVVAAQIPASNDQIPHKSKE